MNHQPLCDDTLGNNQPSSLALMSNECLDTTNFTVEQELKYACRYEEGYDLPDKHYEAWLKINHPQSPKAGSTQQVPSLSVSMSLSENGLQAGLADNAVSLSKCPSPAPLMSNKGVQRSPLSELLNIPVANKPKMKVTTGKARVLTSAECLKALQEKENEKNERLKKKSKGKRRDY